MHAPFEFVMRVGLCQLQFLKGDITQIAVDGIVNAANSELAGGGGVDGAIHRAGGPDIMRELDEVRARIGRCQTGDAVVTGAGRLPAKYVLHAVGPRYRDGAHNEASLLRSCYLRCLDLVAELELKSLSFPSISTGIYRYPLEEAAEIAVKSVVEWLTDHSTPVRTVKLLQFSERDHEVYVTRAQRLRGGLAAGGTNA